METFETPRAVPPTVTEKALEAGEALPSSTSLKVSVSASPSTLALDNTGATSSTSVRRTVRVASHRVGTVGHA